MNSTDLYKILLDVADGMHIRLIFPDMDEPENVAIHHCTVKGVDAVSLYHDCGEVETTEDCTYQHIDDYMESFHNIVTNPKGLEALGVDLAEMPNRIDNATMDRFYELVKNSPEGKILRGRSLQKQSCEFMVHHEDTGKLTFLLSDHLQGTECADKRGYQFSYVVHGRNEMKDFVYLREADDWEIQWRRIVGQPSGTKIKILVTSERNIDPCVVDAHIHQDPGGIYLLHNCGPLGGEETKTAGYKLAYKIYDPRRGGVLTSALDGIYVLEINAKKFSYNEAFLNEFSDLFDVEKKEEIVEEEEADEDGESEDDEDISVEASERTSKKETKEISMADKDIKQKKEKFEKPVQVIQEGEQIVIPEGLSLDDAMKWIKRRKEEDEKYIEVNTETKNFPPDGAWALLKAMQKKYGWISPTTIPGSFFTPDQPPMMITIETEFGKRLQIPWGRFQLPGLEDGFVQTYVNGAGRIPYFAFKARVKQKFRDSVSELVEIFQKILREESIYRGKAFRMKFPDPDTDIDDNMREFEKYTPVFMDVSDVASADLVLPKVVIDAIDANLFTLIEQTETVRALGIPLKRGILLEGPYGVGKTLTAAITAKKCTENGWTFIGLNTVEDLESAIEFAKDYAPAVIFAEDIDRVVTGERTEEMDAILNTIDGVASKTSEIIVVLTTNDVKSINQAMLRPGRLDALISVSPPDQAAVERLIRLYGRGIVDDSESISEVAKKLEGRIPAVIREIVERAKLYMISQMAGRLAPGERHKIKAEHLMGSAESMLKQIELLDTPKPKDPSEMEKFGNIVGQYLAAGVKEAVSSTSIKE